MKLIHRIISIVKPSFDQMLKISILRIRHEICIIELDEVIEINKLFKGPVFLILVFVFKVLIALFDGRINFIGDVVKSRDAMLDFRC